MPKADAPVEEVRVGAGEGDPKADAADFAPKPLVAEVDLDGVAVAVVDAALSVLSGAGGGIALSLPAFDADPNPKPVEPNADAGLPLPAPSLNAPNPKPLFGFDAEPKAGDVVEAAEGGANADD